MNEFIEQFIIESREYVEQGSSALQVLEKAPRQSDAIDELFRALHTLKGSAGIIGFDAMERLLHAIETGLGDIRSDRGQVSRKLNADCLACLDLVARWLDDMETSGDIPPGAEVQAAALQLRIGESVPQPAIQQPAQVSSDLFLANSDVAAAEVADTGMIPLPQNARLLLQAQLTLIEAVSDSQPGFAGRVQGAGTAAANVLRSCKQDALAEQLTQLTAQCLLENSVDKLREQIMELLGNTAKSTTTTNAASTAAAPEGPARDNSTRTLRVDAAKVEQLVRLIGELAVAKNAVGHLAELAQQQENSLASQWKAQHAVLERISNEVQRTVLGIRVLPLRTVLGRFPAMLREMSADLGKPVKLIIEGDETEADKAIVEMLFEPLLHVLRNAMDHGIEAPALRAQTNKPAVATILLRGFRQADRVIIEISDDGRGIDVARVREVALQRGVITSEQLAGMNEAEIIDLIFAAGFSTATQVTALSGRGVGMDAVRSAVSRFGGSVAIASRSNEGTSIRFSLPFSVMMTQVMTVEAGGQTFGIPLDAVVETIRVPVNALAGIGAAHALAHRGRTLPVFELGSLLQVQHSHASGAEAVIVVIAFAGQWGGIRVDRPGQRMEVMLKPMEGLLAGIDGVTGTTIMGDGRVLLVLDLAAILR